MKELLFPIAANLVLGALLLPLLLWRMRADTVRLASPAQAREIFERFFPGSAGPSALVLPDGRAALIESGSGGIGLLLRTGRRWKARMLEPGDVRLGRDGAQGVVTIRFADFGWSRLRLELPRADAAAWQARLEQLAGRKPSASTREWRHA